MEKITREVERRIGRRPYYAYLYATNVLKGRLPERLEGVFCGDPHVAFYAGMPIVTLKRSRRF